VISLEARAPRRAPWPPSISSDLVSGIGTLPDIREKHTSSSPDFLLLLGDFSRWRSKRPWSLFLGFFVVLAILAPLLPFLFGRIMEIQTFITVRATDLPSCLPNFSVEPT